LVFSLGLSDFELTTGSGSLLYLYYIYIYYYFLIRIAGTTLLTFFVSVSATVNRGRKKHSRPREREGKEKGERVFDVFCFVCVVELGSWDFLIGGRMLGFGGCSQNLHIKIIIKFVINYY
jgi:hypothetical protein